MAKFSENRHISDLINMSCKVSNVIRECLLTACIHTNIIANTLCIIFFSEFKHNPILLKQIFHVTDLYMHTMNVLTSNMM